MTYEPPRDPRNLPPPGAYAPMPQYGEYGTPPAALPRPVNLASILLFVGGGFGILGGVASIALASHEGRVYLSAGVLVLTLALFEIYVGVALRRLRPWARTAAIAVAGVGALLQMLSLFGGNVVAVLGLALDFAIIYFVMQPETLAAFQRRQR